MSELQKINMKFHQLKLVYEKIYQTSLQIENCLDDKKFDDIPKCLKIRDKLANQLKRAQIGFDKKEDYPDDINELITKLFDLEARNIERLRLVKKDLKMLLEMTKNKNKINTAYAPSENIPKIIDYRE